MKLCSFRLRCACADEAGSGTLLGFAKVGQQHDQQPQRRWPHAHGNETNSFRSCTPSIGHSVSARQDQNAAVMFGPQSDVNLYRAAANTLKTDSNLVVSGQCLQCGILSSVSCRCSFAGNVTTGPLHAAGNVVVSGMITMAPSMKWFSGNVTVGASRTNLLQIIAQQSTQLSGLQNLVTALSAQLTTQQSQLTSLQSQISSQQAPIGN